MIHLVNSCSLLSYLLSLSTSSCDVHSNVLVHSVSAVAAFALLIVIAAVGHPEGAHTPPNPCSLKLVRWQPNVNLGCSGFLLHPKTKLFQVKNCYYHHSYCYFRLLGTEIVKKLCSLYLFNCFLAASQKSWFVALLFHAKLISCKTGIQCDLLLLLSMPVSFQNTLKHARHCIALCM